MIGIIDYGVVNSGSVKNMLDHIGVKNEILSSAGHVGAHFNGFILPGVGSFDSGMSAIKLRGFDSFLKDVVYEGLPVLGICLGMQLLARASEEGVHEGLGLINGYVKKFNKTDPAVATVPNMGWSVTKFLRTSALHSNAEFLSRFYFVHSYHFECTEESDKLAVSKNGSYEFLAAVSSGNVFGCQFHPEKSHQYGKSLLKGFASCCERVRCSE